MKQPKKVKIKPGSEKTIFDLPDSEIDCKLQDREDGDDSKIIYVTNPKYVKDSKDHIQASPYLAFVEGEYEVVEWSEL